MSLIYKVGYPSNKIIKGVVTGIKYVLKRVMFLIKICRVWILDILYCGECQEL